MNIFKRIDFWISAILILFFLILLFIKPGENVFEVLIWGYFIVGGWQVISMIVHAATGTFTYPGGARNIYHWITLILLVTIPVGSFFILLFAAPIMAVYYAGLCYDEVYRKMRRPLSVLK